MTLDIRAEIERLDRVLTDVSAVRTALASELGSHPPERRIVRAGENLQAALDARGVVELEAGVTWEGIFVVPSNVRVIGNGATLRGERATTLMVPPGTHDVVVDDIYVYSTHPDAISIGENTDKQTRVEDAPVNVRFQRVRVPRHNGKRAFSIHGRHVELLDCEALDVWSEAGQDSQGWYIGNAPGPVTIRGGLWSAGSEIGLIGGDRTRIPGLIPADILVEATRMFRPLSWQTDGVKRKVKNIFEAKTGHRVRVVGNEMDGCWKDAQPLGAAFMLTPTLDGATANTPEVGGDIRDVVIQDNIVRNVGQIFVATGRDYQTVTPGRTTGLQVVGNHFTCSRALFGGFGQLAQFTRGVGAVVFDDNDFVGDGTSLIWTYRESVLEMDGVHYPSPNIPRVVLTGNRMTVGKYGLMFDGVSNAREWPASVDVLDVTGNTFTGSKDMRSRFPDNAWV